MSLANRGGAYAQHAIQALDALFATCFQQKFHCIRFARTGVQWYLSQIETGGTKEARLVPVF